MFSVTLAEPTPVKVTIPSVTVQTAESEVPHITSLGRYFASAGFKVKPISNVSPI